MRTLIRRCQTFVVIGNDETAHPLELGIQPVPMPLPFGTGPAMAVNPATDRVNMPGVAFPTGERVLLVVNGTTISRVSRIRTTSACSRW